MELAGSISQRQSHRTDTDELALDMPIAPLFGIMEQAAFWAHMATQDELKAYFAACYSRFNPKNKAAALAFVEGASV
jgi:hypothetical protein